MWPIVKFLLIVVPLGLSLGLAFAVIQNVVSSQLAWLRFRKKLTGLPAFEKRHLIGNHVATLALGPGIGKTLVDTHKRLGKTFLWMYNDQPAISTTDLDFIKTFIDEGQLHVNRFQFGWPMKEFQSGNIINAEDDEWRRIRRVFAPAFKSSRFKQPNVMREMEVSLDKLIAAIESKLERAERESSCLPSVQLEADELIHRFSMNLVCSSFYKQYDLIDFQADECQWTKRIDEGLEAFMTNPFVKLGIYFPLLRNLIDALIWHLHPQGDWRQNLMRFVKVQTKHGLEARKYLKEQQGRGVKMNEDEFTLPDGTKYVRNMSDYVLDQFIEGKITQNDYFNSSFFLFGAADKTAADSIVHSLYQLAIKPEIQDKLRRSIELEGEQSTYLGWFMYESLRLLPAVPVGCSRRIERDIEMKSAGCVIPKGTLVITPAFVIHRLRDYWGEDADEFKPERWRDTSKHHPMQYLAFGAGPRMCIGKELALHVMRQLFTTLLLRYRFECQPKDDIYSFNSPFLIYIIPNSPTYIKISRV